MSDCQHEWADVSIDQSGDENVFSCLKCGQRLVAGGLAATVIKAEQQLGVTNKLLPLGIIEVVGIPNTWTIEKPTQTGWYWYRKDPAGAPILFYCGTVWDHVVDFAGLNEPVAFMKDHLLEGEWSGPLEPPQ